MESSQRQMEDSGENAASSGGSGRIRGSDGRNVRVSSQNQKAIVLSGDSDVSDDTDRNRSLDLARLGRRQAAEKSVVCLLLIMRRIL